MQETLLSFDLENKSTTDDVVVILVPALLRRKGILAGKFLKVGDFKDETGNTVIHCDNESPVGQLAELDEFASQLTDIQVAGASVQTDNLSQGTMNFMQKDHVAFKPAVVTNIETIATLEAGKSVVNHAFANPFKTGPLLSLAYKLLKGEKVRITLRVVLPDLSGPSSSMAVLPVQ